MTVFYLGDPMFRALDSNANPLVGGKLYTFEEGSSTPKASYADNTGAVLNPNPVILDSAGRAQVWLDAKYKLRLDDSNDVTQWTMDGVAGIGFVAPAAIPDEWTEFTDSSPAFVDATNFSVAGDKRATFQVGRRVRATVTAGTIYGRVTSSTFTTLTTVTVVWDSGALDAGLSASAVGFISADKKSVNWRAIDGLATDFSQKGGNDSFEATTRMLFNQDVPPTGWTKQAENDKALRLTSGAVGSGGAQPWTTVFGPAAVTGGHPLSVPEMPIHDHPYTGNDGVVNLKGFDPNPIAVGDAAQITGQAGGGLEHTHPMLELQYVDFILAEKD